MSKIIDITDKLSFEEKPTFTVKGVEFEANDDAISMLKVTTLMSGNGKDGVSPADILEIYNLLFDEENRRKVEGLKLNPKDFSTLIMLCATKVIDSSGDEGETPTPATT